jgi:transcription elongation factor Elf1
MSIDHEDTKEIVCPHCGHELRDSWEKSQNDDGSFGLHDCEKCGKRFEWECSVTVTYSTRNV